MKYCPKCGTKLPDESNFCATCGTTLSLPKKSTPIWIKILLVILFVTIGFILAIVTIGIIQLRSNTKSNSVTSVENVKESTEKSTGVSTEKSTELEKVVEKKLVKKEIYSDKDGNKFGYTYYKYDAQGNVIYSEYCIYNSDCFVTSHYKYDKFNRVSELIDSYSVPGEEANDGNVEDKYIYIYNDDADTLKRKAYHYQNNQLTGEITYKYSHNQLIYEGYQLARDIGVAETTYSYDENYEKLLKVSESAVNGSPTFTEYTYEGDKIYCTHKYSPNPNYEIDETYYWEYEYYDE